MRLDNEDCTLLQQTIDLLEDVRPREIFAGNGGAPVECRLLYASTHTFGRVADMGAFLSYLANAFRKHLAWRGVSRPDNKDCALLQQTIDLFEDMRPRGICAGISEAPVVIFTDGAHEEDDGLATLGAVLIDPSSNLHF